MELVGLLNRLIELNHSVDYAVIFSIAVAITLILFTLP